VESLRKWSIDAAWREIWLKETNGEAMNMNLQRLAPQSPDIHPATTAVMLRNMIQRLKIRKIEGADGKYRVFALVFSFPASGSMCMPIKSRGLCSDCRSMASIL